MLPQRAYALIHRSIVASRPARERGGVFFAPPRRWPALARRPSAGRILRSPGADMSTPSPEQQQRARIFGVLFALTFITSIAGLLLYDPVLNDADYILGDGADTRIQLGALCEIFLAITNIGTAVVLWPIVRRQSETLALGYVASRVVESVFIVVGLLSLLGRDVAAGPRGSRRGSRLAYRRR